MPETLPIAKQIKNKEKEIESLVDKLHMEKAALSLLQKKLSDTTNIKWRNAILHCLKIDINNPKYFLKSPVFLAECVAQQHKVEPTRDIKNKIATTLSIMFNKGLIGKTTHNGKSYYGLDELYEVDGRKPLTELKSEYKKNLDKLK